MMKLTEQQKNCPYCHEDDYHEVTPIEEEILYLGIGLTHKQDGWHLKCWASNCRVFEETSKPIVAYPICGRPLNEEIE